MNCVSTFTLLSQSDLTVCECEPGWNGNADFYDQRVAVNESSGEWLAISCPNSAIGTYVMYSVFLCTLLLREWIDFLELRVCFQHKKERPLSLVSNMPFRTSLLDSAIFNPMLIAMCILKLATPQVIGTEVAVTLLCALGFSGWIFIWGDFCVQQYRTLVSFSGLTGSLSRQLFIYAAVTFAQTFIYACFTGIPTLAMLFLDKSVGPVANHQQALLIIRNCGVLVWCISLIGGSRMNMRQATLAGSLPSSTPSTSANARLPESTSPMSKVHRVLNFLRSEQRRVTIQSVATFVAYVIFTTPPFFGWQQYPVALLGLVSALTSSSALVLLRSRKLARTGEKAVAANHEPSSFMGNSSMEGG